MTQRDNMVLENVSPTDYARTLLTLGEHLNGLPTIAGFSLFSNGDALTRGLPACLIRVETGPCA